MAIIDFVDAKLDHIEAIVTTIRPADRYEVWAANLSTPSEALQTSLAFSPVAWTAILDGVPFCMFGAAAASPLCKHGIPWMLGNTQIEAHPQSFLRRSRMCLDKIMQHFPILSNCVDARNLAAIRWLVWLGFTVKPAQPYGPFNQLFHPFELRRISNVRI